MTITAAPAPPRSLLRSSWSFVKGSVVQALFVVAIGAAIGWIANVYVMAVRHDGYRVPAGSISTGEGNAVAGSLFFGLAGVVVFSLVGYWRAVGTRRFFPDLGSFPGIISSILRHDGRLAFVHLLWGFAAAVLAAAILSPSISGVLSIGVLVAIPSLVGAIVSEALSKVWRGVLRRVSPGRGQYAGAAFGAAVGLMGACIALGVGYFVANRVAKVVLAVLVGIGALLLGRQLSAAARAVVFLFILGAALAYALATAPEAWADDGGWQECGRKFSDWWGCSGSGRVKSLAIRGATASGIGSVLGFAIGGAVGAAGGVAGAGGWDSLLKRLSIDMPPPLDARGVSLVVHDGGYATGRLGQVWFDGGWADADQVLQRVEAERASIESTKHATAGPWASARADSDAWFGRALEGIDAGAGMQVVEGMQAGEGLSPPVGAPPGWTEGRVFAADGTIDCEAMDELRASITLGLHAGEAGPPPGPFASLADSLGQSEFAATEGLRSDAIVDDLRTRLKIPAEDLPSRSFLGGTGGAAPPAAPSAAAATGQISAFEILTGLDALESAQETREIEGVRGAALLRAPAGHPIDSQGLMFFGLRSVDARQIQAVANRYGVTIDIRSANVEAARLLEAGARLRPPGLDALTVTPLDIALGARADDIGKVAWFVPALPEGAAGSVHRRYQQRLADHADQSWRIRVLTASGRVRLADGIVLDVVSGRPFTGDMEIYSVSRAEPVPATLMEEVLLDLEAAPLRARHGALCDRAPSDRLAREEIEAVRRMHVPGGTALARFVPGVRRPLVAYDERSR